MQGLESAHDCTLLYIFWGMVVATALFAGSLASCHFSAAADVPIFCFEFYAPTAWSNVAATPRGSQLSVAG
jgi:hypothetical protein